MDFKKLFRKDDKAVSPVIGVILMVAITVILAAAIGSSVFSKGTAQSAPQASLDLKATGIPTAAYVGTIKMEHLGGDQINLDKIKIMSYVNSQLITTDKTTLTGTFNVGDVKTFTVTGNATYPVASGSTVNVKVVDSETSQLISDKNVRFP